MWVEPTAPTSDGLHANTCSLTAKVKRSDFNTMVNDDFSNQFGISGFLRAGIAPDKL